MLLEHLLLHSLSDTNPNLLCVCVRVCVLAETKSSQYNSQLFPSSYHGNAHRAVIIRGERGLDLAINESDIRLCPEAFSKR